MSVLAFFGLLLVLGLFTVFVAGVWFTATVTRSAEPRHYWLLFAWVLTMAGVSFFLTVK